LSWASFISKWEDRRGGQGVSKSPLNPHRKNRIDEYLAQCFARRGINDLAATTLQDAIKEKVVFDDEKKDLILSACLGAGKDEQTRGSDRTDQTHLRGGCGFTRMFLQRWMSFTGALDPG